MTNSAALYAERDALVRRLTAIHVELRALTRQTRTAQRVEGRER